MWKRGKLLGSGAFGSVYLATSTPGGWFDKKTIMAVKSSLVSESDSLFNERTMLKELDNCPNIIRCFAADLTVENGKDFYNLLLEYANGGDLANRKLSEPEIRRYTLSIVSGLSYMHRHGIVHCDIKPANILIVKKTAKIADLGLAKKVGVKGFGMGTPIYMAPESITRGEYEPKIDVWALGCTVLEMITGKRAWNCEDAVAMYKIGYTDEIPEIPSWVSYEAQDFIKKCLVRDPSLRFSAKMLLSHPFVSSVMDDVIIKRSRKTTKDAHELKPRMWADQEKCACNLIWFGDFQIDWKHVDGIWNQLPLREIRRDNDNQPR